MAAVMQINRTAVFVLISHHQQLNSLTTISSLITSSLITSSHRLNYIKSYHFKPPTQSILIFNMHFSTLTTMAVAMASTLATAMPVTSFKRSSSNTTTWPVSGFSVGCSPAACVYNLAVTRASGPSNPGFNTTCTGNDYTSDYQACADDTVYARIVPETGVWQVDVRHKYATDASGGFIEAWANATVDDSTADFAVTVYQTEGAE
jgi:hypothetical protein